MSLTVILQVGSLPADYSVFLAGSSSSFALFFLKGGHFLAFICLSELPVLSLLPFGKGSTLILVGSVISSSLALTSLDFLSRIRILFEQL
jgi:hypothetical protein